MDPRAAVIYHSALPAARIDRTSVARLQLPYTARPMPLPGTVLCGRSERTAHTRRRRRVPGPVSSTRFARALRATHLKGDRASPLQLMVLSSADHDGGAPRPPARAASSSSARTRTASAPASGVNRSTIAQQRRQRAADGLTAPCGSARLRWSTFSTRCASRRLLHDDRHRLPPRVLATGPPELERLAEEGDLRSGVRSFR
jgi:hypothetical protein